MIPVAPARLGYRPELDGIRGIAVLLVIAHHARLPFFTAGGTAGVTLFFVLSGYLITSLLIAERAESGRVDLRAFYVRRIRRLLPALVAVVLAVGVLLLVIGRLFAFPWEALPALLYSSNIVMSVTGSDLGFLGHTWSLSLEEQFYAVWPLLFVVIPRRWLPWIAIAGIVAATVLRFVAPQQFTSYFRPDLRMDAVLWGCVLALVPLRVPRWAGLAGLAVLAFVAAAPGAFPIAMTVAAVASFVVVAAPPRLTARWLVRTGQISYGLYLWHFPIAVLLRGQQWPMSVILTFALAFLFALASERWVERPFRLRRVLRERPSSAAPIGEQQGQPHGLASGVS